MEMNENQLKTCTILVTILFVTGFLLIIIL